MLTLRQFAALAESYGAELERWPQQLRGDARTLLEESPAARTLLDKARSLDAALEAASLRSDRTLWPSENHKQAALGRLRGRVAERIAEPLAVQRSAVTRLGWLALVTAASVAVVSGFLIGSWYTSSAASEDNLLTVLQPVPIHLSAE
jgi:hypothetical protein